MPRLSPRSFLVAMLACSALSLSACDTISGWFGRGDGDRNAQSLGARRAPSANPEGAASSEPAQENSDTPFDQYNADGTQRSSAAASVDNRALGNTDTAMGRPAAALPSSLPSERRRPIENLQAEAGIDGTTAMAAPVSPLDLPPASTDVTMAALPAPSLPAKPMPLPAGPTAPPPMSLLPMPAEPAPLQADDIPPASVRPVTSPNGYPALADTPEVPSRIEAFRKNRAESRDQIAALEADRAKAESDHLALLSETGGALPPSLHTPENGKEVSGESQTVAASQTDTLRESAALDEKELAALESSTAVSEPAPVAAEKTSTGIRGWFRRTFGKDKVAEPEEKAATRVEPVEEASLTAPVEEERSAPLAVAEPEEEPIVLRPPPGVADVPDAPPMAMTEIPDNLNVEEGFALRAPTAIAKARFLPDSRYAARRMTTARSPRD